MCNVHAFVSLQLKMPPRIICVSLLHVSEKDMFWKAIGYSVNAQAD
jgi:hypothetical protein